MAIVSTAGFFYSEQFRFERPHHADYASDTLAFFQHENAGFLKDPKCVFLVVTDKYRPNESDQTEATIPQDNGWEAPAAGEDVIVGLAIWRLEPGSKRIGQFQNDTGSGPGRLLFSLRADYHPAPYPELPETHHRDEDLDRLKRTAVVAEKAEEQSVYPLLL